MDEYKFEDILTGSIVTCAYPGLESLMVKDCDTQKRCSSLFFPGCSFINYGLPLVQAVYDLLKTAGRVDGMSLLCCGKILSYEPDGQAVRAAFEKQLCDHVAHAEVQRIVTACPNCTIALRTALENDERTAKVKVVALPSELIDLGYHIDADVARRMLADQLEVGSDFYEVCTGAAQDGADLPNETAGTVKESATSAGDASDSSVGFAVPSKLLFSVHDSCPDRQKGEYADGLRALMPAGLAVDPEHVRKHSQCCGSLVRAAGKIDKALEQSRARGVEAIAAGGSAIVTSCMSCTFLLSVSQRRVPVFHYLELLYDWRIDWAHSDQYMKLRFLFDDTLGVGADTGTGSRSFVGLKD